MKRILCLFLALVLLIPSALVVSVFAEEDGPVGEPSTPYGRKMERFIVSTDNQYIRHDDNFGYTGLGQDYLTNFALQMGLGWVDLIADSGTVPDETVYTEMLVSILVLYDQDNAADVNEQLAFAHRKDLQDYALDIASIAADTIAVYTECAGVSDLMIKSISVALDALSATADSIDEWVDALSIIQTLTQDYSDQYDFLTLMIGSGNVDLMHAAQKLRDSLEEHMNNVLGAYQNATVETVKNYGEFLYGDVLLELSKNASKHGSSTFLAFLSQAGDVMGALNLAYTSLRLGGKIGVLLGDALIGGEDLIRRAQEIMALEVISMTLVSPFMLAEAEYMAFKGTEEEERTIRLFVSRGLFLTTARLRGECSVLSVVVYDPGLLKLINKSSQEEANAWYDVQSGHLMRIRGELREILRLDEDVYFGEVVSYEGALYYWQYSVDSFIQSTHGAGNSTFNIAPKTPNALIRNEDGNETVLLADTSSGAGCGTIAAANGKVYFERKLSYESDGVQICSVDIATGEVKTHLDGTITGLTSDGLYLVVDSGRPASFGEENPNVGKFDILHTDTDTVEKIDVGGYTNVWTYDDGIYYASYNESYDELTVFRYEPSDAVSTDLITVDTGFYEGFFDPDPIVCEVRYPTLNGKPYLYFSYGFAEGEGSTIQAARIARVALDGTDAKVVAGTEESIMGADYTVNSDGSVNILSGTADRTISLWYEGFTTCFWKNEVAYAISRSSGESVEVMRRIDSNVVFPGVYLGTGDASSVREYLNVESVDIIDGMAYIRLSRCEIDDEHMGWRLFYTVRDGALFQRDLTSGDVLMLYRY